MSDRQLLQAVLALLILTQIVQCEMLDDVEDDVREIKRELVK